MNPTERTLQVLEYLMAAGPSPIKQVDIARDCGMSGATLNRIIRTLSDWGYLFRTSEKYCVRNFRLSRNVPMSAPYLAELEATVQRLTDRLQVSAEVIVVAGHELMWHSKTEHPDPNVFIRANVGFRRSLYELDALALMYLSRLNRNEIAARFYTEGFYATGYRTGREIERLSEGAAADMIDAARDTHFAFDPKGNHVGIRRFATVISDPQGRFLHLVSIAEPMRPTEDEAAHVEGRRRALGEARQALMSCVVEEDVVLRRPPKHQTLPSRGG